MKELTLIEEMLLTTIWRLKDNAYGVAIRKEIATVTGKDMIYGTLYNMLDQLVRKGYVSKTPGPPTPERGGRSKMFYQLSRTGIDALLLTRDLRERLWRDLPELAGGEK